MIGFLQQIIVGDTIRLQNVTDQLWVTADKLEHVIRGFFLTPRLATNEPRFVKLDLRLTGYLEFGPVYMSQGINQVIKIQ
jgi:hypothetical protein